MTIDSTAEREYEECLVKSRFLHTSPVEFQLFESMLLEDGEYFLLARHLERLRNSAEYFGFVFPEEEINSTHLAAKILQGLQGTIGAYGKTVKSKRRFHGLKTRIRLSDVALAIDTRRFLGSVSLTQNYAQRLLLGRRDLLERERRSH